MNVDSILNTASGALTPTVALLALYVAYRQYRVERHKAKIELFDRRFGIYETALSYAFAHTCDDEIPSAIASEFYSAVASSRFLFGNDVCNALKELQRRGQEIAVANRLRGREPPESEMRYVYAMREHQQWFTRAEPFLSTVFARYLKVA